MAKQTLRFAMSGLDQGVDPKLAKGMLLLENCTQERKSEFVKRNGLSQLTGSYTNEDLAIYRGRPVLFGNAGVYTEAPGDGSMSKVDDAGFMDVELVDIGVGGNCIVQVCQVLEGGEDFLIVSYIKRDQVSSAQTTHLAVYDRVTGRLVDSTTTIGLAVLVDDGTDIFFVHRSAYYTGSSPGPGYYMAWGTINTSTGAIGSITNITNFDEPTSGSHAYDVCVIDTSKLAIIHVLGTQPGGSSANAGEAQVIVLESDTPTRVSCSPGESVRAVSCWLQAASLVGVAVSTDVSDLVRVGTVDDSPAVSDALVSLFDTSATDDYCGDLTGIATSSTAGRVYFSLGASGGDTDDDKDMRVAYNTYSGVGSTLTAGTETDPFEEGCRLASQPFEDSGGDHYVVLQRTGDYLKGLNKLCMVVSENDQIFARFLMDKAMADFKSDPGFLMPVTDRTDSWTFGAVKRTGFETSGVVAVRLEKLTGGVRAVEAHGLLVLPGAHPWVFDGSGVTELGFLHSPRTLTITPKGTWDILNDIKTQYTAHIALGIGSGHPNGADSDNTIGVSDATDDASAYALANDIKDKLVDHGADTGTGAPYHGSSDTITISAADADDYDSLVTLTIELLEEYNTHRVKATGSPAVHDHFGTETNEATEDYDTALEAGLHGYQAVYERYLVSGHRDQSAPSPLTSFDPDEDLGGNAVGEQLQVKVEELHHTKQSATIVLYRTEANLSQVKRLYMQTNDVDAYQATINDGASDTGLDGQPNVYTTGRRLENLPPPPSRVMWVHQERLFAVNREEESWDVRYSMQFEEGKGIAFNDVLQMKCSPAGGRITAGASLMGRGVLFKTSSIYTFYGKGLGLTGTGAGYSTPQLVSPAIGCVNFKTLVETPLGLMFESEDGLYLLTKQFQVVPIGQSVKYHTDNVTLSGVAHVKDRHQVVWSSDGVALVYDYVYNTWSTFTGYAATDICANDDGNVFLKGTSTTVHYENRAAWKDGLEILSAVPMLARSAWVDVDQYQRIHRLSIMGQARSDCTLRLKVAFDYQLDSNGFPRWTHNLTFDLNALSYHEGDDHYADSGTAGSADDAMLLNVQLARRCRSFMIEISDETRDGQSTVTKGFSLTGIELEVTPKSGLYLPGQTRQIT